MTDRSGRAAEELEKTTGLRGGGNDVGRGRRKILAGFARETGVNPARNMREYGRQRTCRSRRRTPAGFRRTALPGWYGLSKAVKPTYAFHPRGAEISDAMNLRRFRCAWEVSVAWDGCQHGDYQSARGEQYLTREYRERLGALSSHSRKENCNVTLTRRQFL